MLDILRKRLITTPLCFVLAALQAGLPVAASAQTATVTTLTKEEWENKQKNDARRKYRATDNTAFTPPSAAPDLRYNNLPPPVPIMTSPTAEQATLDANRAAAAATRYFPATDSETNSDAQTGHTLARDAFSVSNARGFAQNPGVSSSRRSGSSNEIGVDELFPGYGSTEINRIMDTYGSTYDDPSSMKGAAEYSMRQRLKRNGCQRTDFHLVERLSASAGFTDRAHRILSITFFDYTRTSEPALPGQTEPCVRNGQPSTCVAQDKERFTFTPSGYQGEAIKLDVALFQGEPGDWMDFVSDTRAVQYDYNPFSFPASSQGYFPYNVRLLYRVGGAVYEAPPGSIVSYGSPTERWRPIIQFTPPVGTQQIILVADAYKAMHHYIDPEVYGRICPPMPPVSCTQNADDGTPISWCAGQPGHNIVAMFNAYAYPDAHQAQRDAVNPMYNNMGANASFFSDGALKLSAFRGLNAGSSAAAASLASTCYRVPASRVFQSIGRAIPSSIQTCSREVVDAFVPNGCSDLRRAFGLASIGQHAFLTVRAWRKRTVVIPPPPGSPPGTPSTTFCQKEAQNVTGSVNLADFPVFGGDRSSNPEPGGCDVSWLEYIHTPFGGDPNTHAVAGASANGGSVSVSHYGRPSNAWAMSGSASGGGLSQMTVAAHIYMVTVNEIAGCSLYYKMLQDNICRPPTLTCTNQPSTVTVAGVTFGEGLPTSGIVDLLAPWLRERAHSPGYEDNGSGPGDQSSMTVNDNLGLPVMCWNAAGTPLLECSAPDSRDQIITESVDGGVIRYASDCAYKTADDDRQLRKCMRAPSYDKCSDERMVGVFSGMCYSSSLAYDCRDPNAPTTNNVGSDAYVEVCNGGMRCMGTQCHRPNLSGLQEKSFAEAAAMMEVINHIKYDMVCAETGEPPTSVDQPCTLRVFKGKKLSCAYAVGFGKLATTATLVDGDCCKEAWKKASSGLSWEQYFQIYYIGKKLAETGQLAKMASAVGLGDAYNSVSKFFGEVSGSVRGVFDSVVSEASTFIQQNIATPVSSALDGFFGGAGAGSGATPVATGVDSLSKVPQAQSWFGSIGESIAKFKQLLMNQFHSFVKAISPELAQAMFVQTSPGNFGLNPAFDAALMYWSIARILVSIIFACKQEDYEWGMQNRWRLCAYAGECCSRKIFLVGCVQKRKLYCCYKSIVARVIATEIITKELVSGRSGYQKRKCHVNCDGFSVEELSYVDWSRVDMTEAIDAMIDSGIINPNNPQARYGVIENRMSLATTVGGAPMPEVSDRVAADKTSDSILSNAGAIIDYGGAINGLKQCYDESNPDKMPFQMSECPPD